MSTGRVNIPMIQPSFPDKTLGIMVKGFMRYSQTFKQTNGDIVCIETNNLNLELIIRGKKACI